MLHIFARRDLVDDSLLHHDQPAVLLEGSWPIGMSAVHETLEDALDNRFAWIDEKAACYAEGATNCLSVGGQDTDWEPPTCCISDGYLNVRSLRYYLVKLIRTVVYFREVRPIARGEQVLVVGELTRDDDYVDLITQLCEAAGADCRVQWIDRGTRAAEALPANPWWRRTLGALACCFSASRTRRLARGNTAAGESQLAHGNLPTRQPRVVLCGDARLLEPVGRVLLDRGARLWWLYDRFALKSWWRWARMGVSQLVCNASQGRHNEIPLSIPTQVSFEGVELAKSLNGWLRERSETRGPHQTRLVKRLDAHFRRVRPDVLLLDEDATPMARAAVAVARRYNVRSLVVQHGVPCVRFGFAPLVADRIAVWGEASAEQLRSWGVGAGAIRITGCPLHEELRQRQHSTARGATSHARGRGRTTPRILLLNTVPPQADRPDAITLNLTERTYEQMLRMAFAAVAELPQAELVVKMHPRARHCPVVDELVRTYPTLNPTVVRSGPLARCFDDVDCVLSCGSSAGIEATIVGLSVIQIIPAKATGWPRYDRWGLCGTARSREDLLRLLGETLATDTPASGPAATALAAYGTAAAEKIAEAVFTMTQTEGPRAPATRRRLAGKRKQQKRMGLRV